MSRARNIKPGFFKNDRLAECDPLARILFAGLWCEADRSGRLEDRPKRLKAEYLGYDSCDVDSLLNQLCDRGFIIRYVIEEKAYIAIPQFSKHQNPHIREQASTIPEPDKHCACTVQGDAEHRTSHADSPSLIPDSPLPITDSKEKKTPSQAPAFELPTWIDGEVWAAYLEARAKRRAPNTARAFGMVVRKLAKLRDEGDDPNASLEQSARSGWSDVYPVRADVRAPTSANVVPSGQRAAGLFKLEGMKSANHNQRLDYRSDAEVDLPRLGGPARERGD